MAMDTNHNVGHYISYHTVWLLGTFPNYCRDSNVCRHKDYVHLYIYYLHKPNDEKVN